MIEKIKSLSKQTLIYGTSTIIGRFLNFILVPFYTNVFPPAEYGIIALIYAYIAFFNVIYSLGLEAGFFRFASSNEIGSDKQNFSIPFLTIFINGFIFTAIIILFSSNLSALLNIQNTLYIIYAALILFFDSLVLIPFAYLRLKNHAKKFAFIKIINIAVNVALNLILILVFNYGLIAVFISNLFASVFTFLILLPIVIKNLSFKYHSELFKELFKFSIPYLPAGFASMIVQVIDKPIMQYLTNVQTVGIYTAGYKLGIFMMLIVSMFEYAWRPFFLNNAKDPDAKNLFAKILTLFVGASSVILIILTFFIKDIVQIPLPFKGYLIGKQYWAGIIIVPVILFAYIFLGIYINFLAGIYIEKKTKYLPLISGAGALINIIFCFVLIPIIGIMGGAAATLASYIVMAVYIYFISNKFYPVNYQFSKVISILLIDIFAMILFYLFINDLSFIPKIIISLVLIIPVLYISEIYKANRILINKFASKKSNNFSEPQIEQTDNF